MALNYTISIDYVHTIPPTLWESFWTFTKNSTNTSGPARPLRRGLLSVKNGMFRRSIIILIGTRLACFRVAAVTATCAASVIIETQGDLPTVITVSYITHDNSLKERDPDCRLRVGLDG